MRIGAEWHQHIGKGDHLSRFVRMRIKANGDGQIRPHHGAHAAQHFGFRIIETNRHHGAVQIKINTINRAGFQRIR